MAGHKDHQHRWMGDGVEAIHCRECSALLEPYVAQLEHTTAMLRARRVHLNERTVEALDERERLARKNMALQARLARAMEIVQMVAERRMPHYCRALDAWVCDYCDQESRDRQAFRHDAECVWDQAHALLAGEASEC
jgi:hypothetical protein